jgi:hypothetical protein
VQTTVRTVFAQFDRLGSANAVLRYFRDAQLVMHRPVTSGEERGTVVWRPASYAAIHLMLTNPAYAGAFAFGRRHHAAGRIPGESTPRARMPLEEWQVLVHDVYPAYITRAHYLQNRAPQAESRPVCLAPRRAPPGHGLAAGHRLLCAMWTAPDGPLGRERRVCL